MGESNIRLPFSSSLLIDDQLRPTLDSLIAEYIQTWYSSISTDTEFIERLSSLLATIISRLEKKLQRVDFIQLLCLQLPVILKQHLIDYSTAKEKLNTAYSGGRTLNELFHGSQPHFALDSSDRETEYLRNVSDTLLHKFLPFAELKSDILRFLLRELLSNVVLSNLVERLCNPDYISTLIVENIPKTNGSGTSGGADLAIRHSVLLSDNIIGSRSSSIYTSTAGAAASSSSSSSTAYSSSTSGNALNLPRQQYGGSGSNRNSGTIQEKTAAPFFETLRRRGGGGTTTSSSSGNHLSLFKLPSSSGAVTHPATFLKRKKKSNSNNSTTTSTSSSSHQQQQPQQQPPTPSRKGTAIMGGAGLVQGINKIMFGGLNKMTSGLDKFKTMVEEDFKAGRKKIRGKKSADGDISGNDYSSSGGLISDDEILYSRPPTLTLNSEKSLASTAPGNYNDIISKTRSALLEEDRLFDSGRYESGSVNNFEDMVDDTDQLNRSFDSDRKVGTSGGGAGISGSVFGSLDYLKSTSGNIVDDSMVQHPDDDDDSASNAAPYATGAAAVLEDESEDTNDGEEEEEEQEGEEEENQEFILCEQDNLKTAGFPLSPSSPSPPISPDEIYNHRTSFPVSDEASIFSSESSSSYSPTKTIITNSVSPLMIAHAASSLLNFDYIWNSLKLMYQYIRLLDSDSSHNNPSNISAESQIMEKYEGEYLEEQLLELAIQIFRLNKNYMWAVTQVMFFVKPIAHLFFGRIINKIFIRGVYSLILSEQSVAIYISTFRHSFFPPSGITINPFNPIKSVEEKQYLRSEAEDRLRSHIPAFLYQILGKEHIHETVTDLMEVFQSVYINKHLVYILLDIILVELIPEVMEET